MRVRKKLVSAVLALCFLLALFPMPTRAATIVASGPCGAENAEDLIWTLDENGLLAFVGSGAMKNYSSGSKPSWYSRRSAVKIVSLPSELTHIGNYAFYGLDGVTEIAIPDTVTSIGNYAFYNCDNVTALNFPQGLTSIGEYAFYNCSKWVSPPLPESLTKIGANAFNGCAALETLIIPIGVTEIGGGAFANCPNFTATVYNGSYGQRYCLLNSVRHNAIDPNTYTITFHPNGGDGSPTTKTLTDFDTVYGETPTPTRDGYTFLGWHTATDGGELVTSESAFSPKQDQTLYAVWEKIVERHTVTLEANGGSVTPKSVTVEAGGVYGDLPAPTRKGCKFLGWFTEPTGGEQIASDTPTTGDRTLYAHWMATNTPEISDGGAAVTDVTELSTDTTRELDGSLVVADAANPEDFYTATAFCAVYDASGLMVHLQTWEIDVSDPRNICFMGNIHIPEGVAVSEIKIMILSDDLTPLQAAGTL